MLRPALSKIIGKEVHSTVVALKQMKLIKCQVIIPVSSSSSSFFNLLFFPV